MAVEELLVSQLKAITGLNEQVYPVNAPAGQRTPYLVYRQTSGKEADTLTDWAGLITASYDIDVMHATYKGMKELTALVVVALKTLRSGTIIQSIDINEDSAERYEDQLELFRKTIEITIQYWGG